ncbi:MAG: hypothetical protein C0623_11905 [Desulfuromonas sp.]|nr:MAG: hypothetical protein C0623_11905 [Desulfuromonas sp.]
MKWRKLGRIYCLENVADWAVSHCANPFPEHLQDDVFRIYFSCRDAENRSSITCLDFDVVKYEIISHPSVQVLGPGDPGLFDDSGCSIGCIVNMPGNKKYLYYMGWCLSVVVPWRNTNGLAICENDRNEYVKYSTRPIMGLTEEDLYTISYPAILKVGDTYKMWYGSNLKWGKAKESMNHVIKYAESRDGIHWDTSNHVCIKGKDESEYAFARFSVLHEDGIYKIWYSYRGQKYRIGYAESKDGLEWERMDDLVGIDVSDEGWDSEMIEYPAVFDHKGKRYMLYCGNEFGKTGFGMAELVQK